VPAVVNTSFNLAGEPIVSSAADAVATFVRANGIDLLVLDEMLVSRGA
jgi:carbamoyltransferase